MPSQGHRKLIPPPAELLLAGGTFLLRTGFLRGAITRFGRLVLGHELTPLGSSIEGIAAFVIDVRTQIHPHKPFAFASAISCGDGAAVAVPPFLVWDWVGAVAGA